MTTVERPLILLDVDGPLNPYLAKPTRRPVGYDTHRLTPTGWSPRRPLRVWLNPRHGDLLLVLAELTGAELVWCTTWNHDANEIIAPLIGLPSLPTIVVDPAGPGWKFTAVLAYVGLTRPVLWFDDDFRLYPASAADFLARRAPNARTRLHYVAPDRGLRYEDVEQARSWLLGENEEVHRDRPA